MDFTYLKIQPIEAKCLDQTEDGFAKETGLISTTGAAVDTSVYHTR